MILNAVIIVLREVLEAALLLSVFLALGQMMKQDRRWVMVALVMGSLGAVTYAVTIRTISNAFDGVGQEVFNAVLHSVIFIALLSYFISAGSARHSRSWHLFYMAMMVLAVIVATGREGAEIILYIRGFLAAPEMLTPVLLGSVVGAGIGLSVGVFFYYLLVNLNMRWGLYLSLTILVLLGSSMVSQAVQFLIQADIISSSAPLWNTSAWISERSITGQLLYALIGYEATPAPVQAFCYFLSIVMLSIAAVLTRQNFKEDAYE